MRGIDELVVFNDEAHHVHDEKLAWFQSIQDIHNHLKQKINFYLCRLMLLLPPNTIMGAIFVQTISDYPLVEAIAQISSNIRCYQMMVVAKN